MTRIVKTEVQRCKGGYWTHPELPDMGETVSKEQMAAFEAEHGIKVHIVSMESDADESVIDNYFERGEPSCIEWEPTKPEGSAFLLSIHDTEDGPYAWWAVPVEPKPEFNREHRYVVAKMKDIDASLDGHQKGELFSLLEMVEGHRVQSGKLPIQCVVVEHDWPNYSETWASVERLAKGNTKTVEGVLYEMASNARENGCPDHADALEDAIQRMYDEGLFQHTYYCECDNGCGNSYQEHKPGVPCLNCGAGTMQAQDVEPWG
ncbi:TPA: hypothetical protein ACX3GV_004515 [Vibrio parahaemolyticus]